MAQAPGGRTIFSSFLHKTSFPLAMFSLELTLQLTLISKPLTFLDMVGAGERGAPPGSLLSAPKGKLRSAGELQEMQSENDQPLAALWFGSINIHRMPTVCQALCLGLGRSKTSGLGLRPSYRWWRQTVTQYWGAHVLGPRHTQNVVPDCFYGVTTSEKPSFTPLCHHLGSSWRNSFEVQEQALG